MTGLILIRFVVVVVVVVTAVVIVVKHTLHDQIYAFPTIRTISTMTSSHSSSINDKRRLETQHLQDYVRYMRVVFQDR